MCGFDPGGPLVLRRGPESGHEHGRPEHRLEPGDDQAATEHDHPTGRQPAQRPRQPARPGVRRPKRLPTHRHEVGRARILQVPDPVSGERRVHQVSGEYGVDALAERGHDRVLQGTGRPLEQEQGTGHDGPPHRSPAGRRSQSRCRQAGDLADHRAHRGDRGERSSAGDQDHRRHRPRTARGSPAPPPGRNASSPAGSPSGHHHQVPPTDSSSAKFRPSSLSRKALKNESCFGSASRDGIEPSGREGPFSSLVAHRRDGEAQARADPCLLGAVELTPVPNAIGRDRLCRNGIG